MHNCQIRKISKESELYRFFSCINTRISFLLNWENVRFYYHGLDLEGDLGRGSKHRISKLNSTYSASLKKVENVTDENGEKSMNKLLFYECFFCRWCFLIACISFFKMSESFLWSKGDILTGKEVPMHASPFLCFCTHAFPDFVSIKFWFCFLWVLTDVKDFLVKFHRNQHWVERL